MIVREALERVPDNFDYYNDYKDTKNWLEGVARRAYGRYGRYCNLEAGKQRMKANMALRKLEVGYHLYIASDMHIRGDNQ
jgi:hypothetical protein